MDHITPVAEGGGECDVDNLRTLCTVCHRDVTAQQNKERAKQKQRQLAAKCGDITAFFSVQWLGVIDWHSADWLELQQYVIVEQNN